MTHPSEYICPISQDLMVEPVKVNHNNIYYRFDKNCIVIWRQTPNGDKNPLTMVSGFKYLELEDDLELKEQIDEYRETLGISPETLDVELEPFSDYEQVQEDYRLALELYHTLNGENINNENITDSDSDLDMPELIEEDDQDNDYNNNNNILDQHINNIMTNLNITNDDINNYINNNYFNNHLINDYINNINNTSNYQNIINNIDNNMININNINNTNNFNNINANSNTNIIS